MEMASKTILQLDSTDSLNREQKLNLGLPAQYGQQNYVVYLKDVLTFLDKTSMGLGNVDNTADLDKPLSNLAIQALNGKADAQHTHTYTEIQGLTSLLGEYYRRGDQILITDIAGLVDQFALKANVLHQHTLGDIQGLSDILGQKADAVHNHAIQELQGFEGLVATINNGLDLKVNVDENNIRLGGIEQNIAALQNGNFVTELPGTW